MFGYIQKLGCRGMQGSTANDDDNYEDSGMRHETQILINIRAMKMKKISRGKIFVRRSLKSLPFPSPL